MTLSGENLVLFRALFTLLLAVLIWRNIDRKRYGYAAFLAVCAFGANQ